MSRSVAEIFNRLNQTKASMQELQDYVLSMELPLKQDDSERLAVDVSTTSKVANWRLWLWIVSVASWLVETLFDRHKQQVSELLSQKRCHTLRWYAEESKKFQLGYPLQWKDNQYVYETQDSLSRIITYAAASEQNGVVKLKVAKEDNGGKTPLSALEKNAFTEFWNRWRDAGVKLEVVSLPPDVVKVEMTVVRDRLVLNGDNTLMRDPSVNVLDRAIEAFSGSLEFDATLRLSALVDAIQGAEGVVDVKLSSAWHKPAGGEYHEVDMMVVCEAGYFVLSKSESLITLLDQVNVQIQS